MGQIDWSTAYSFATEAAAGRYGAGAVATMAQEIKAELFKYGSQYDAVWTTPIDAAKALTPSVASAVARWSVDAQSFHNAADASARSVEAIQTAANMAAGIPQPYQQTIRGVRHPLAPTVPISFDSSTDAATTAAVTFSSVLRLVARDAGPFGNGISATIGNSTRTSPDPTTGVAYFKLTLTLGSYTETYDDLPVPQPISLGSSALVASATWYGTTRPSNATAAFSGGARGSLAALTARLQRAEQMPDATAYASTLAAFREALAQQWAARPTTRDPVPTNAYTTPIVTYGAVAGRQMSVMDLEDEITALIERAANLFTLVTFS